MALTDRKEERPLIVKKVDPARAAELAHREARKPGKPATGSALYHPVVG